MKPYVLTAMLDSQRDRFPRMKGLSPATLDAIAERKFNEVTKGSYNKRNKLCTECREMKSVSGSCSCNE